MNVHGIVYIGRKAWICAIRGLLCAKWIVRSYSSLAYCMCISMPVFGRPLYVLFSIVRSIRGLRNSLCAKYRFASDSRLSPRLLWIRIVVITVIASILVTDSEVATMKSKAFTMQHGRKPLVHP